MNETVERAKVAKTRSRSAPLSVADKELKAMQAYMKKVNSSKKTAEAFLRRNGVIDKKGQLAELYRS